MHKVATQGRASPSMAATSARSPSSARRRMVSRRVLIAAAVGAHVAGAQQLKITTCSDTACSIDCITWEIEDGYCATCDPDYGPCRYEPVRSVPCSAATSVPCSKYYDTCTPGPFPLQLRQPFGRDNTLKHYVLQ